MRADPIPRVDVRHAIARIPVRCEIAHEPGQDSAEPHGPAQGQLAPLQAAFLGALAAVCIVVGLAVVGAVLVAMRLRDGVHGHDGVETMPAAGPGRRVVGVNGSDVQDEEEVRHGR